MINKRSRIIHNTYMTLKKENVSMSKLKSKLYNIRK